MPNAVTHVLTTIIILDIFRDYIIKNKKLIPLHFIFIGGIAGLLPDIDVPVGWIAGKFGIDIVHGFFTHTLLFVLIFLFMSLIYYRIDKKISILFLIITFGVFWHILLDFVLGGGYFGSIMLFYPFSAQLYELHLLTSFNLPNLVAGLDAVILLLWLYHEEKRHKISDFI